jgi:hypothetical protein
MVVSNTIVLAESYLAFRRWSTPSHRRSALAAPYLEYVSGGTDIEIIHTNIHVPGGVL